ncbi:hypothetical protein QAD02_018297 [Eretmocerus hayati]|uniref:Uncharacterized protein n=1 Tax=Eretmocerus hayati TaxID=131215 RepID=A0ACC2PGF9_9HYME|nr:hypothetical protein QAD02_018297 [Eretmocerus hayati]
MARIVRFILNVPLIPMVLMLMLILLKLKFVVTRAKPPIDLQRYFGELYRKPRAAACNFEERGKVYAASDLIMCIDELARNIIPLRSTADRMQDRLDQGHQEGRQLYPVYPYDPGYPVPPITPASSNFYGNRPVPSLLSGLLPFPDFSSLFDFGGFMRPGLKLVSVLSSIARYDDLKCVPRLLCEVASGSLPGSLSYRQNGYYQDFSQNPLFSWLSAFDTSGISPLISFGRAALLGYSNRGHSSICYQEYYRCPRRSDQLISYLNNHNGGFFKLFNSNNGNFYRPQQSYYRPFYKDSGEHDIEQANFGPLISSSGMFLDNDVVQPGPGISSFGGSSNYFKGDNKVEFFSNSRVKEPDTALFPEERQEGSLPSDAPNKLHVSVIPLNNSYVGH